VACPFFMPIEKFENGAWVHPARLPLGCGWSGHCTAPGHEGEKPAPAELQEFCNLGYAEACTRMPRERAWDSVRVGARRIDPQNGLRRIQILYVCERDHRPVEHGSLYYDAATAQWLDRHRDARVQRMAECFLASQLEKRQEQLVDTAQIAAS
jgi:hypothetical protein